MTDFLSRLAERAVGAQPAESSVEPRTRPMFASRNVPDSLQRLRQLDEGEAPASRPRTRTSPSPLQNAGDLRVGRDESSRRPEARSRQPSGRPADGMSDAGVTRRSGTDLSRDEGRARHTPPRGQMGSSRRHATVEAGRASAARPTEPPRAAKKAEPPSERVPPAAYRRAPGGYAAERPSPRRQPGATSTSAPGVSSPAKGEASAPIAPTSNIALSGLDERSPGDETSTVQPKPRPKLAPDGSPREDSPRRPTLRRRGSSDTQTQQAEATDSGDEAKAGGHTRVHIDIGRLEIRATKPPQQRPPAPQKEPFRPRTSLQDYLAECRGDDR